MDKLIRFVVPLGELKFADSEEKKQTSEIQVCMVGKWEHEYYGTVEFTRQHLREMVQNFKEGKRDVVIDYNHGTRFASDPESAKAAGWIKDLYTKERGTQLWATVEWTDKAVEYIQAGEYKYISPECTTDGRDKETGAKLGAMLVASALTNRPFLEGMAPVELSEGSVFVTSVFMKSPERGAKTTQTGGSRMDEKRIREILGLTEDTQVTDEHRNKALTALDEKLTEANGKVKTLTEQKTGTVTLAEAEVTALRANADAGAQAAKQLKEMQVGTALSEAQRSGKIAGVETPLYAQVKKTLEGSYQDGIALIEALPKVVDFSVRGADGDPGGDGGGVEVKAFVEGRISGENAVTMSVALSEAYTKFGKDKVNAWRYKKTG